MKANNSYFTVCQFFFILSCCVGGKWALSYLDFVHGNNWAAWQPGLGIALLFTSMTLSFVGYARIVQRSNRHLASRD